MQLWISYLRSVFKFPSGQSEDNYQLRPKLFVHFNLIQACLDAKEGRTLFPYLYANAGIPMVARRDALGDQSAWKTTIPWDKCSAGWALRTSSPARRCRNSTSQQQDAVCTVSG